MQKSMSLKYEPASEPLHISVVVLNYRSCSQIQLRQLKSTDVVHGLEAVVVEIVDLGGLLVDLPRGQLAPKLTDLYRTPSMST